jgi:hypothetical protein
MSNTQISQKDAVINAVASILGDRFEPGINARELLSAEEITSVKNTVSNGILNGSVSFSKDVSDEKAVRRYVAGLVDNHLRKAKELNGGVKYAATTTRGPRANKAAKTTSKSSNNGIDMSVLPTDLQDVLSNEA